MTIRRNLGGHHGEKDLLNRTQESQAEKLRLESKLLIEVPLSIYFDLQLDILHSVSWMGVIQSRVKLFLLSSEN